MIDGRGDSPQEAKAAAHFGSTVWSARPAVTMRFVWKDSRRIGGVTGRAIQEFTEAGGPGPPQSTARALIPAAPWPAQGMSLVKMVGDVFADGERRRRCGGGCVEDIQHATA